jgi:hypothetical protein
MIKTVKRRNKFLRQLFEKIGKGESIRINSLEVKESGLRVEQARQNRDARLRGEVQTGQKKYSVSNSEKEGYFTITNNL